MKYFLLYIILIVTVYCSYGFNECNCEVYEKLKEKTNREQLVKMLLLSKTNSCLAKGYELLALNYLNKTSFDTSQYYLKKAESTYKSQDCSIGIFLNVYKVWAQYYYTIGDFPNALEYCLKLLPAAEMQKDNYELANGYTMIAQLFNQMGQAEKGIIYLRKSIPISEKIKNNSQKMDLFHKISKRFLWHYQDLKVEKSLDSSELFSKKHLALAKLMNDKDEVALAYNSLQGVAYERGRLKEALKYLDSAFFYTNPEDLNNIAVNYYDKADILFQLGDYTNALRLADTVQTIYTKENIPAYKAEAYDLKYHIYKTSGNYAQALTFLELKKVITDSITNLEKTTAINELEQKYNKAQNEKTIKELSQAKQIASLRNKIYITGIVLALLIIVLIIIYTRQRALKNKQENMEIEQRLNRARMNPHFFFNTLNSLQTFSIQENKDSKVARYLSKYAKIMRETLESTYKEMNTIEQELDYLTNYLDIQKIRYPEKFEYHINLNENIEPNETYIPAMIIQPFIENSIEHGLNTAIKTGSIIINITAENNRLIITIDDNGTGFTPDKKAREYPSRATQIIKDRLLLLNKKYKTDATYEISKGEDNVGTCVKIILPLIHSNEDIDN